MHRADTTGLRSRKRLMHEEQTGLSEASIGTFQEVVARLSLSEATRVDLDNALYKNLAGNKPGWLFVKINPAQHRYVVKVIHQCCRNVSTTLSVWTTALTYMRMDTGEILATRKQLAEAACTLPCEVSRAMSALVNIGAIKRTHRGHRTVYAINPTVGWNGGEGSRQEAARTAPLLRLVADNTHEDGV